MTPVLGIDIGGTNTAFGLVDDDGRVIAQGSLPTRGHGTFEHYVEAVHTAVRQCMDAAGIAEIAGVGVGAPNGNFFTGEIQFAPNLPWTGVLPVARLFEAAFGVKTVVTNDANAAALGEKKFGCAKEFDDFVLVTLGTGLGSGFVANGQLVYGHDGFAGELGHVVAERRGRTCGCGRQGCLERYASATGIVITAQERMAEPANATLLHQYGEGITAADIAEAAAAGDAVALEIFDYTARILGEVLADTVAITSPKAFVFFGGLANAGELLMAPLRRHLEANLLNIYQGKVRLLLSALPGSDAAILGAAAIAR